MTGSFKRHRRLKGLPGSFYYTTILAAVLNRPRSLKLGLYIFNKKHTYKLKMRSSQNPKPGPSVAQIGAFLVEAEGQRREPEKSEGHRPIHTLAWPEGMAQRNKVGLGFRA